MIFEPVFLAAYLSDAVTLFDRPQLLTLLRTSRENNARIGVTGLLLHADGNFLQALEGPEESVRATLARIERDTRHHHMQVLCLDHVPARLFGEWSMGLQDTRGLSDEQYPGLSAFMRRELLASTSDHIVMELLRSFSMGSSNHASAMM